MPTSTTDKGMVSSAVAESPHPPPLIAIAEAASQPRPSRNGAFDPSSSASGSIPPTSSTSFAETMSSAPSPPSSSGGAQAAAPQQQSAATSAVNRSIDDLHLPTWLSLIAASAFCRTLLQHPLNVAVSRKRISDGESPSLRRIFGDAFKGLDGDLPQSKPSVAGAGAAASSSSAVAGGGPSPSSKSVASSTPANVTISNSNTTHYSKGVRNLYRGFGTAAAGNVIGEILYLVTVETVRHRLMGKDAAAIGAAVAAADPLHAGGESHHMTLTAADSFAPPSPTITGHHHDATTSSSDPLPPAGLMAQQQQQQQLSAASQARIDATAGMVGDVTAILVCTPLSVAVNRQMTAGYGLNRGAAYTSLRGTLRGMWGANGSGGGGASTSSSVGASITASSSSSSSSVSVWRMDAAGARAGLKGWYAGLSASLFMLPASGLWWASYGQLKRGVYAAAGPHLDCLAERHRQRLSRGGGGDRGEVDPLETSFSSSPSSSSHSTHAAAPPASAPVSSTYAGAPWYLSSTDNPILNGFAGVLATLITTVAYNPVSVLRTRLQALPPPPPRTASSSLPSSSSYPSSSSASAAAVVGASASAFAAAVRRGPGGTRAGALARDLIAREGYRGFFKGALTNASVSVVDGLLFATLYELTKYGSDRGEGTQ